MVWGGNTREIWHESCTFSTIKCTRMRSFSSGKYINSRKTYLIFALLKSYTNLGGSDRFIFKLQKFVQIYSAKFILRNKQLATITNFCSIAKH
jgi:hypothetical protein